MTKEHQAAPGEDPSSPFRASRLEHERCAIVDHALNKPVPKKEEEKTTVTLTKPIMEFEHSLPSIVSGRRQQGDAVDDENEEVMTPITASSVGFCDSVASLDDDKEDHPPNQEGLGRNDQHEDHDQPRDRELWQPAECSSASVGVGDDETLSSHSHRIKYGPSHLEEEEEEEKHESDAAKDIDQPETQTEIVDKDTTTSTIVRSPCGVVETAESMNQQHPWRIISDSQVDYVQEEKKDEGRDISPTDQLEMLHTTSPDQHQELCDGDVGGDDTALSCRIPDHNNANSSKEEDEANNDNNNKTHDENDTRADDTNNKNLFEQAVALYQQAQEDDEHGRTDDALSKFQQALRLLQQQQQQQQLDEANSKNTSVVVDAETSTPASPIETTHTPPSEGEADAATPPPPTTTTRADSNDKHATTMTPLSLLIPIAACYSGIGSVWWSLGDLEQALTYFHWALEQEEEAIMVAVGESVNDGSDDRVSQCLLRVAASHNDIGLVHQEQYDDVVVIAGVGAGGTEYRYLRQALHHFRSAVEIQEEYCPETLILAATYNNIGLVFHASHEWDKALDVFALAEAIEEQRAPNTLTMATTYMNMGAVWYDKAKSLPRKMPTTITFEEDNNNGGLTTIDHHSLNKALEYFRRALEIQESRHQAAAAAADNDDDDDPLSIIATIASTYDHIGRTYHSMKQMDEALKVYHQSLQCYKVASNATADKTNNNNDNPSLYSSEMAMANNNIGLVLYDKQDWDGALEAFRCALSHATTQSNDEDWYTTATSHNNMGLALHARGDHEQALEHYQQALELEEKAMNDGTTDNDDEDDEEDCDYDCSLSSCSSSVSVATSCANIGSVLLDQGEYEAALERYTRALELLLHQGKSNDDLDKKNTKEEETADGDHANDKTDDDKEKKKQRPQAYYDPEVALQIATAHENVGRILHAQGEFQPALEHYQLALELEKKHLPNSLRVAASCSTIAKLCLDRGQRYQQHPSPLVAKVSGSFGTSNSSNTKHHREAQPYLALSLAIVTAKGVPEDDPNLLFCKYNLGRFALAEQDYKAAIPFADYIIDRVVLSSSDSDDEYYRLAYTLKAQAIVGMGELEEAIDLYDQVLEHFPDCSEAHCGRLEVRHALMERHQQAAEMESAQLVHDYKTALYSSPSVQEDVEIKLLYESLRVKSRQRVQRRSPFKKNMNHSAAIPLSATNSIAEEDEEDDDDDDDDDDAIVVTNYPMIGDHDHQSVNSSLSGNSQSTRLVQQGARPKGETKAYKYVGNGTRKQLR